LYPVSVRTAKNQYQKLETYITRKGIARPQSTLMCLRDLVIPTIDLPILVQEMCGLILGIYKSLTDTCDMNVEMGTEAVQFPEKEYINGIFVVVCDISLKFRAGNCIK
jgi:hypothetical protein